MDPASTYTPFDEDLGTLTADDLAVLSTVKEGWFVEYKRELPNARGIAKSISSFANTYGGWLFVGVEEKSKEDAVAGGFPGIDNSLVDGALQSIRQAIAASLSSAPYIEVRAISGPSRKIKLPKGKSIICIRIPSSLNAPFVHASGQIYRRVADGSEPKPEADRFLLDQLWRRGDDLRRNYRRWVKRRDPEFSEREKKSPYLRILLVPDLWQEKDISIKLSLKEVRNLFNERESTSIYSPFESVHANSKGFIARQIAGNDASAITFTWQLGYDLVSEIYVPLTLHEDEPFGLKNMLRGYDHGKRFCDILSKRGFKTARIIDLNLIFILVMCIVEQHEALLCHAEWEGGYYLKARLLNVWRTVPFLDTQAFVDDCSESGVPICLTKVVTVPPGFDPETFRLIVRELDKEPFAAKYYQAVRLFVPIAEAFGVPIVFDEETVIDLLEVYKAGARGLENQKVRTEGRAAQT